jgi:hypothetical protein
MATNSKAQTTHPDRTVDAPSTVDGLLADGLGTAYGSQNAAWTLGLEAFERGQRLWWDQWQRMTEVTLAAFLPVTDRQLSQRFEAAERRAAERQTGIRADFDRALAELREGQRESAQAQAQAIREATREQRAARAALDEAVEQLSGRLDRLARAQDKQLDSLHAALTEHEQRLRERLGDRIRSAVGAVEAARPSDLEELRRQVAALSEVVTTARDELSNFTREWREQGALSGRPSSATGPAAPGEGASSEPSGKE